MSVDVLVPPVGTNVDTVTLVRWYREEGETVQKDEPLFAVETDKATLDIEAPASGVLRQVACGEGAEVAALSRIAVITPPGEEAHPPSTAPEPQESAAPPAGPSVLPAVPPPHDPAARVFISPRARQLAERRGLDWRNLRGTGPEGAVVERDIRAVLEAGRTAPAITPLARRVAEQAGTDWTRLSGTGAGGKIVRGDVSGAISPTEEEEALETIPLTGVRGVIRERMVRSHTETAPVTLTTEVDATGLAALREDLNADGVRVSYNDLLLFILARVLREHPRLNASLQNEAVQVWKRIHIGLAVDTDRGLLVPVVRDADRLDLAGLARETAAMIEKARTGRAAPDDLRGGTFTLTNLGMYGIDAFTPIINLPECAILGAGRIRAVPAVVEDQVVVRRMMWLSLTFDHRLVDGGPAARFLQRVARLVEKPHLLLAQAASPTKTGEE